MAAGGSDRGTRPIEVVRAMLRAATALAALCLAVAWVLSWIPSWPVTLFEHFRVQYVLTGALLVVAAGVLRMRYYFDVAAIATLLHVVPVTADLMASSRPGPVGGAAIRVLVLNVHTESTGFDKVRQLIADENPDVVGLIEVDRRWLDALAPMTGYPARLEEPRSDNFGVALYARGQLTGSIERLGSGQPSVVADVDIAGARFRVLLTHPVPPVDGFNFQRQQAQLDAVAERAQQLAGPLLVLGDFNTTPWSRGFARLLRRTGLCDSRAGSGVQASFPVSPVILRIPIDHLLASCSIGVRDRRIGRDVGSDHLPVIVDLVLPP